MEAANLAASIFLATEMLPRRCSSMQEQPESPLDRVTIPEPCPMASELARGGNPDRRYCEQCEKHVVNLSALEKQRAEEEVRRAREAGKRLCVRVIRDQETGKILTREDLPRLVERLSKHRPPKVAAALALAILQWSCSGEDATQANSSQLQPPVLEGHTPVVPEQYLPATLKPLVGEVTSTVGEVADQPEGQSSFDRPLSADDLYLLQQLGGYIDE